MEKPTAESVDSKQVIGRGTWLDSLASRIIEREKTLKRSLSPLRVESGLGASGIPHVGSLGDAVRAYGVRLALEDMGWKAEFMAFSDDLDGLRKVPAGLPDWLREHIGRPVKRIPDPLSCHGSYGDHMSSILTDALDKLEVEYTFKSGAEVYSSGVLDDKIALMLENSERIGRKIAEMSGQTKYEAVLPYFPICEQCGRLYLAQAYEYLPGERKVRYRCSPSVIGRKMVEGCGYSGELRVGGDRGKMSWKVEFAARWAALDIRFEAYGKDIADSVRINDWVSDEVLNFPHPSHVRYEMFLDKSGKKISKSVGNVFTPQAWLRYGSAQSLLLLMYKRIAGTRNLGVEDIPVYMDEYNWLEDIYFGKIREENQEVLRKLRGLFEYIHHLKPPSSPSIHVPYRLMVEVVSFAPKENMKEYVAKRLMSYGMISQSSPELDLKIELVANWVEDFKTLETSKVDLKPSEREAIQDLIGLLESTSDPKALQNQVFETAKKHGIEPPIFFKLLYRMILGVEKGPRLGNYLMDLGKDRSVEILSRHLS